MNKRDMLGWEVGGGQLEHQPCRVRMGILLASTHVRVGPVGPTNRLKSQHSSRRNTQVRWLVGLISSVFKGEILSQYAG